MKNRYYKAHILTRFLTKKEQVEFDEKYDNAKVRRLGSGVAQALTQTDNKFVNVGK